MVSTGVPSLDKLLPDGYPDKSAILIVGSPGVGKEALGYWFTNSGLVQGDFSICVTKRSVQDVLRDAKGFGVDYQGKFPYMIAREGGQGKFDISDLAELSFNIKEILRANKSNRIRITMDIVSPLLMLNPSETVYKFLAQLIEDTKQYDAVMLATLEESMHTPQVLSAMQELFDGVLEMRIYEESLRFTSLLRILKMLGVQPATGYFRFMFTRDGMEIVKYVR